MRELLRRLLARRVRNVTVLGSVLAVVTASALWLTNPAAQRATPDRDGGEASGAPGAGAESPPPGTGAIPAPTTRSATASVTPSRPMGNGPPQPRPGPGTLVPATPSATVTTGPPQMPGDLLKRQDPVPEGVAAQVDFFLGGGLECGGWIPGTPGIGGVADIQEIPSGTRMCFDGFDLFEGLKVTVRPPAGRTVTAYLSPTFSEDRPPLYRYPRTPGDPLGRYHVTAEQGDRRATLEFTVRRATEPLLWVDRRSDAIPGDDIHVYVGGFPPSRWVSLDIYSGRPMSYQTSFPIWVDEHGEGHAVIDTKLDDTTGCYGISHPLVYDPDNPVHTLFCIYHP